MVLLLNVVFIASLYSRGGARQSTAVPPSTPAAPGRPVSATPEAAAGTPLLDRLDRMPVHRDAGSAPPLERCARWTAGVPDVDMEEPLRWQMVVDDLPETFVFSAFFDPRYA